MLRFSVDTNRRRRQQQRDEQQQDLKLELTLVHFSAQLERCLWFRGCVEVLFRGRLGAVGGFTECFCGRHGSSSAEKWTSVSPGPEAARRATRKLASTRGSTRSHGQSENISHIDTADDHIDSVISHIIGPYPMSISRMTISI